MVDSETTVDSVYVNINNCGGQMGGAWPEGHAGGIMFIIFVRSTPHSERYWYHSHGDIFILYSQHSTLSVPTE